MDTIYLDKTVSHLGYSTMKVFEGTFGDVSIGKTASCAEPFKRVIIVHALGLTVVDTVDIDVFKAYTDAEKEQYIFRKVIHSLTPEIFAKLLEDTEKHGIDLGKAQVQAEIRAALGIYK